MRFSILCFLAIFIGTISAGQIKDSIPSLSCNEYTLFESDELLEICLKGDIRKLFKDRGDNAVYHPFQFTFGIEGISQSVDIRVKTRGNFRKLRENCRIPPLLLNFDSLPNSGGKLFYQQNKLKLVTACQNEKYVLREYLAYKIYQLVSEKSFCVRLVTICFEDSEKGKTTDPKYGILLEDQNCMAERNQSRLVKRLNLNPKKTDREMFLKMAVFQFLIGNTDWSIQYLHNIKLISGVQNAALIPVPYDFDHSGIVDTPYALPAEELQMRSVRQRRYRGYCLRNMEDFESTFAVFKDAKEDIYNLYKNSHLLEEDYIKSTLKYLDEFYDIISDKKKSKRAFQYPCNKYGTGNVVIKGINKIKPNK
ncbi:hypothetical protein [Labilibaculum antarcticum]|uniref:Uncharacterized protein n=1 Tax=Labilibaculum antarcticum TaxID=1717717 RepID=A0A1Y1CHN5_9BACT|nr:hypothetical protein [Labilibaculum antarcticum]BAX79835.1 hypothetical protein ALGA_1456 [Labilibaculum antarcticum]